MFKSVFSKMLVTYLIIILSVLAVMSVAVSILYGRYLFEEKRKNLESAAYKAGALTEDYLKSEIEIEQLNTAIDSMGLITESSIYIVKINKEDLQNRKIDENLDEPFIAQNAEKVLNGEKVYIRNQYSSKFEMSVIFVGYPLKVDSEIQGAILIFSPVSSVTQTVTRLNIIIWLWALGILLISVAIIYLNALKMTKPIRELDNAAKKLAQGENIENIEAKSKDEIGRLVSSFNFMKDKIEATEKMRREFIANVSHDLRTPLTSINGFVSGMLDGIIKPDEYPENLNIIKSETKRLIDMTGDILELAKIQSQPLILNKEKINVLEICQSATDGLRILADEKNIKTSLYIDKGIYIKADKNKIMQILANILGNAIKFTQKDGEIEIKAENKGDFVEIEISDNGIGISKEDLPYIFEKFYRADKVRNKDGGVGLGLNIVKVMVELHGGRIWAESEQNKGTSIHFTLPKITKS